MFSTCCCTLQAFYRRGEGRLVGMQMTPQKLKLLRKAIATLAENRCGARALWAGSMCATRTAQSTDAAVSLPLTHTCWDNITVVRAAHPLVTRSARFDIRW